MSFDFHIEDEEKKKRGRIINMNEISQRAKLKEKEKFKDELSGDIDDVIGNVMKKVEKRFEEKKTPTSRIIKFFKMLGFIGLGILVLNFILFNVWLLKYFIKSIFIG